MLKFAYRLGFELALQEELQKIAGIPGEAFKIAPEAISKALAPRAAAPVAEPGIWQKIRGFLGFNAPAPGSAAEFMNRSATSPDPLKSRAYLARRGQIRQQQLGKVPPR
jgi:hypothetical protein